MVKGPTCCPISAVLFPAGSNSGGKKTDQPNIFIFVAKTNAKINISRLTFQNYLTLDGHCVQPFCTRMSTVSHLGEKKNQCKTAATDLSTSANTMLCVYRQW